MLTGKMWRTRVRPLVLNFFLFGLGVTTCLMFIQISNNDIDSPVVYTNLQEYHSAQQLQTQQEAPCNPKYAYASVNGNHKRSAPKGVQSISSTKYYTDKDNALNNNVIHANSNFEDYEGNGGEVKAGELRSNRDVLPTAMEGISVYQKLLKSSDAYYTNSRHEPLRGDRPAYLDNNNVETNDEISNNINTNENDQIILREEDDQGDLDGPTVWVVTPTFYRPEQRPELTRLAQALLPVRHFIHWIIVDDIGQGHGSDFSYKYLESFVKRFSIRHTILKSFPPKSGTKIVGKPRGVGGRRAAIDWLRTNTVSSATKGVVYFADDDNTYDSDIFRQMQNTKKVSMWPVGLVTELGVSSPIVKNGRVVGFYDGWNGLRKFPVDMAGFAINIQLFLDKPHANMPWVAGYEEDELLRSLEIKIQDIQPLANNCTEILVWHTKAVRNVWPKRPKNLKPNLAASTNLIYLLNSLPQKSLAGLGPNQSKSDNGFSLLNFIFGGL